MPKFNVKTNEILFYEEKEIEAKNKEEAKEKYFEMIAMGNVDVCKNDYCDITVKINS